MQFTGSYMVPGGDPRPRGSPALRGCHTGAEPSTQHNPKTGMDGPPGIPTQSRAAGTGTRAIRQCLARQEKKNSIYQRYSKLLWLQHIYPTPGAARGNAALPTAPPSGMGGFPAPQPAHGQSPITVLPGPTLGFSLWAGEIGVQSLRALSL